MVRKLVRMVRVRVVGIRELEEGEMTGMNLDPLKERESLVKGLGIEHVETEPERVVMTIPVDERHTSR